MLVASPADVKGGKRWVFRPGLGVAANCRNFQEAGTSPCLRNPGSLDIVRPITAQEPALSIRPIAGLR